MQIRSRIRLGAALVAAACLFLPLAAAQEAPWERASNASGGASRPPEDRIDINHATLSQLLKAPGMTQVWAARVVRFRPYRTKLDLIDRGILPSATYDRMKDRIVAHSDKAAAKLEQKKQQQQRAVVTDRPPANPSFSW